MKNGKQKSHYGDRIAKVVRESKELGLAREIGGSIKSFVTDKPVLSTCIGLAAGIVLGMLIPRSGRCDKRGD